MTKYQPFNDLPAAQFAALVKDVERNGVLLPIVVDENDRTIDGHQRRKAAAEAGVNCPRIVIAGLDEDEKRNLAITLNLFRRHLSGVERSKALQELANLGMSTRRIADALGTSKSTVHRDLTELSHAGQLEDRPDRVEGADGKSRPAKMPPRQIDAETGEILGAKAGVDDDSTGDAADRTPDPGTRPAASTSKESPPPSLPEATPDERYRDALRGALNAALKLTTQFPDHGHNLEVQGQDRDIFLGDLRSLARWVEDALAADDGPRLKVAK